MTTTVLGEVERVTFENEETSFRVIRLSGLSGLKGQTRITAVGVMQAVGPGTQVRVSGRVENDPRHGERLKVESLVVVAPDTLDGLEKFLASGVIHGIGEGFAKRIVKYFGLQTLKVLDDSPHRLGEVPGLGPSRVEQIRSAWIEHTQMSNVLLALSSHGTSPAIAGKIVERFGQQSAEVVQFHPYRLAIFIVGIGFKTADRIARKSGLALDHPERAQAGLLHVLRSLADAGDCYCPRDSLVIRTAEMLSVEGALVESALDSLWAEGLLVVEDRAVFLKKLHQAESRVAERILELARAPSKAVEGVSQLIKYFEASQGIELSSTQKEAVHASAEKKFLVVTGGPGVGKTTLVRAILSVFSEQKLRIQLAAPTGRAAKRLSESTGRKAVTLHRLLEQGGRGGTFARHAKNPIESDLVIIDEASMIDIHLADGLFSALPNATRVVLVGDADQLPSVGPGAVLSDVIASKHLAVARLSTIFRQKGESGIIENSHCILRGEEPFGAKDPNGDFFIVKCRSPEHAASLVAELVKDRIPKRFGLDANTDVQVLTPMHGGVAGTRALNQLLQESLNPRGEALSFEGGQFRVGDKVLQLKNDYEKDVFNGDQGAVFQVQSEPVSVTVSFDGDEGRRLVTYEKGEVSQLGLAYATSIHKSQGSEFPAVVIPFLSAHYVMLSRNLLYTAVTRAKRLCVLLTDDRALSLALGETRREERQTKLTERLKQG